MTIGETVCGWSLFSCCRSKISHDSGWHIKKYGEPGADRSDRFQELIAKARSDTSEPEALPSDAKDFVYLLVPGLFTENYPGYMSLNIKHLEAIGLDVREVAVDTDVGVLQNAEVIRDEILKVKDEGKSAVVIGHSKGGVDAAAAIALFDLYEHVRAFLPVQAPYGGTPVTEMFDHGRMKWVALKTVKHLLHGDIRALTDLSCVPSLNLASSLS